MHASTSRRWSRLAVLVLLTALAWSQPRTASAWHGRWWGGWGPRAWCGPVFGPRFYGGWGGWYGGTRFAYSNSVYLGGPFGGFFSGGVRSFVVGGPAWCGPTWYGPAWGGSTGWPCTYYPTVYPWGWGWQPIVVSPFPGSIAPVYGPAGVLPYMGFGFASASAPAGSTAGMLPSQPPAANALARLRAGPAAAAPPAHQVAAHPAAPAIAIRSSNGAARLRAGRLVAIGDRHLRTAVHDTAKLPAALDAYRRAATIAPDLPDTFLRQAIVLTALDRDADAARAVERAVTIDARLGTDPAAALAAGERLPPDPVFGERPDTAPSGLESRGEALLARIFTIQPGDAAVPPGLNWIADRWSRRHGGPEGAIRADTIAAK